MNMRYKIGGALASAVLMLTLLAPKAFATDEINGSTLEISGNGNGSNNTITVVSAQSCDVTQKANTSVEALVGASSDTGGNTANGNTGGTTEIDTGNATSTATVDVTGGSNTATDPCCCNQECPDGQNPNSALISGNGNNSTNTIIDVSAKSSSIKQKAKTAVGAIVLAKAKTGKNKANNNTGSGTTVKTGNAISTSGVDVTGGTNTLNP